MTVHQKSEHLFLVDLDQPLTGFRQFISCWIYQRNKLTILVDPGPFSTIHVLEESLSDLGITEVNYILLTHIHIDHAGGAGALLHRFPSAKIICHPGGIFHMINPEKLWQASLKVLGEMALAYQPIIPVAPDKILYQSPVNDLLHIKVIETPGHAMHHLNFIIDNILFAGEVAGVNIPMENELYLRIATPPRFIYDVYKNSLYKAADLKCNTICFGHYDLRQNVSEVFNAAKQQLKLWMKTVQSYHKSGTPPEAIFEQLLDEDPFLNPYKNLEKDIQQRERYFAINSIKGMLEYLQKS